MTNFLDRIYHLDGVPVGGPNIIELTPGNVFFLDPANGSDDNGGQTPGEAFKTFAVAYAALTDAQNDVLYLIGDGSLTLPAVVDWTKSYTHFIGLCAPTKVGQRARIFQLATLTGAAPLFKVSGSGNIFANFYIFQGVDDATSLIDFEVSGGRNYFGNVHFAGGGHASQAIDGGASLKLNGAAENLFKDCVIGVDTIDAATGMVGILIDTEAKRNIFEDCMITMSAGHTGAAFVELVDTTAIDRYTLFKNCTFLNSNFKNFLMASAFVIPAIAANRNCAIVLQDCIVLGVSKLDASDRGFLYGNMGAITGADLSGVAVELIS